MSASAGDVPWLEVGFPEPIHASGRDITEVDCSRSQPTHGAGAADKLREEAHDFLDAAMHVARKAGDEHCVDQ